MRFKLLVVALGPLLFGISHASYDLLLVADQGGIGQSARIHRYDATSGRFMGSFAERIAGITALAAIRDTGRAYAINAQGLLLSYDYSTGISHGVLRTSMEDHQLFTVGNRLYAYSATRLIEISTTTGATLGVANPPSGESYVFITRSSQFFHAGTRSGTNTRIFQTSLFGGTWTQTHGFTDPNRFGTNVVQGAFLPNLDFSFFVGPTQVAGADLSYYSTSSLSGTTGIANLNGNRRGFSVGHDYLYVTGSLASDATQGRIGYIDFRLNPNSSGVFGGTELRNPIALASVVAPEPGTLLALGAGLALLARRRRQR